MAPAWQHTIVENPFDLYSRKNQGVEVWKRHDFIPTIQINLCADPAAPVDPEARPRPRGPSCYSSDARRRPAHPASLRRASGPALPRRGRRSPRWLPGGRPPTGPATGRVGEHTPPPGAGPHRSAASQAASALTAPGAAGPTPPRAPRRRPPGPTRRAAPPARAPPPPPAARAGGGSPLAGGEPPAEAAAAHRRQSGVARARGHAAGPRD